MFALNSIYAAFLPYFIAVIITQIALSHSDVVFQDPCTVHNVGCKLPTDRFTEVVLACPVTANGRQRAIVKLGRNRRLGRASV
ncbi:MAG TPA: hypothetical protein VK832_19945 [Burkholderiaceae bacterium]|jgi:hypothetical protein|nr:hypothetical protein [Burkholderiaceae bacterium]